MLAPSAHVDTFTRDNLPAPDARPPLDFDPAVFGSAHPYPDRLNAAVELLDTTIARFGAQRRAVVFPGGSWTYADLRDRVNRLANLLVNDYGVVPGNRVLLRMPNNEWLVASWLAVLKTGAVAVTTMPALRATELRTVHEIAGITVSLVDHRFLTDWADAGIGNGAVVGGGADDDVLGRLDAQKTDFAAVETSADDVAILAFTSGTTGRPKATMHFHRDMLAVCDTFSEHVLKPTPDDLFVGSPPIGFTFGLGALVLFPMRAGAATLVLERPTPDALVRAISEHGVTVMSTAPTAYRAMLTLPDADFTGLRRCVSAGEPLGLATWQAFFDRTGCRIIDGIGSTEMLHIFISCADDEIRPGATGRPVPGYRACILDDVGNEVPDGTLGRLAVRGPTGCRYLNDPRQANYVQHGWNLTGDTYLRDDDGFYWYQARNDDMIISAGFNIAGPEVEMALLTHPDVLECAVVGAPDEQRTMIVHAFVVLRPGASVEALTLQEHCRRTIAAYKAPRVVEFIDALPRTTTGKVQRFRLREMLA
ncbi:MAG TPA: AMP-binding protein [Micromonosporaceae bacterium]|jgi:2-aminobenzoate-CoA ligase|nr:AMP-binding protein [Micromonosporaceae bacterium]